MLQKIHERLTGWITAVIIGVLCLAFALWGVQYYVGGGDASGKVLAKVGDKKITTNDVNMTFRSMQQEARARGIELNQGINAMLKQQALSSLISKAVLSEVAAKEGFVVSKQQAQQLIMSIPAFQEGGKFAPQRFQAYLYNSGLTPKGYLEQLKSEMLVGQVASGIQGSTFILPSELKSYYDLSMQQRSFGYMVVPGHQFIPQVKVTDQQIKDYYNNNKDNFKAPEKVSIEYIELSPKTVAAQVKLSDAELKQYYKDNIGNYRTPQSWKVETITVPLQQNADAAAVQAARKKAQQILAELKKAKSFSTVMQQYKGETKTYTAGVMPSSIQAALTSLKENQTSQPITTQQGYVVLHLVAMTPAKTQTFAEVESKIKQMLARQKTQSIIAEMNEKLSNLTFTNPDTLAPAAKALGVEVKTTKLFARQGAKEGIAANPKIVSAAFSKDVLQQGNNSDPLTLKDGSVVVLRVKEHIKSKQMPLSEVAPKVRMKLLNQLADVKASMLASKLQQEINQGKAPKTLAAANNLTWVVKQDIKREDKSVPAAVLKAAFEMSPSQVNHAKTVVVPKGDTVVLVLQKISPPDFSKVSDVEKEKFSEQLAGFLGRLNYGLYALEAKKKIEPKLYEKNLKNLQ